MSEELYVTQLLLEDEIPADNYLSGLPVIKNLYRKGKVKFHSPVTFFVGENGIGKSTLIEAIAIAMRFNPEGGTRNFNFKSRDTHSTLHEYLRVGRTLKYRREGFFLRAESFYNMASYIENIDAVPFYGGVSLHAQSHGESFLSVVENRFQGDGIYILDEPEAALSPNGIMRLMILMHELVKKNSQFIISTHSPLLMTFPGAEIIELTQNSIEVVPYQSTEHFQITKLFIESPERMLRHLFDE